MLSTDKIEKETRKFKIYVVEGKNKPTIFLKIFDINLRSRVKQEILWNEMIGNFLIVLKSPIIIITKSQSCKKSLSADKVYKVRMKS